MRFATVIVKGQSAKNGMENIERSKLVDAVVRAVLKGKFAPLDCLVFPGGFFRHDKHIGNFDFQNRKRSIEKEKFSRECTNAAFKLSNSKVKTFLVCGVDTHDSLELDDSCDQLAVAWNSKEIVGIGKKVWPSPGEQWDIGTYTDDYATDHRIIRFNNERTAVLCACYDIYGISETPVNPTGRTNYIHYINTNPKKGTYITDEDGPNPAFKIVRSSCVASFQDLLKRNNVTIAICPVHGFKKNESDLYFQRFGFAVSATYLKGITIGAAHYAPKRFPPKGKDVVLAAKPGNWKIGNLRKHIETNTFHPAKTINLADALIQIFEFV